MTEGEWQTVTRDQKKRVMRRKGRTTKTQVVHQSAGQTSEALTDGAVLDECLQDCQSALLILCAMNELQPDGEHHPIARIVCYGIGNFSHTSRHYYAASLWQLATALALRQKLSSWTKPDNDDADNVTIPVDFFEPFTTAWEADFLRSRGIQVLTVNEHGRRPCHERTLFWMPHCPSGLYENVLWSNWTNLNQIVIIGNSLRSYSEALNFDGPCIQAVQPWLTEVSCHSWTKIDAPGNVEGAFNDTYLSIISVPDVDLPERPYDRMKEVSMSTPE